MVDTTKIADNIDGLADREFKTGGMKLSFGSIMAILAFFLLLWVVYTVALLCTKR
jgi:hypothetical protein